LTRKLKAKGARKDGYIYRLSSFRANLGAKVQRKLKIKDEKRKNIRTFAT
jgi:hypothetical protein